MKKINKTPVLWIVGYTTNEHLLLDLDNTSFDKVCKLMYMIFDNYPEVGDCLIMESSIKKYTQETRYNPIEGIKFFTHRNNYHVIFDNKIPYSKAYEIIEMLAELDVLEKDYVKIRSFRGDMTLRISDTQLTYKNKPMPYFMGILLNPNIKKHDGFIQVYLSFYQSLVRSQ